MIAKKLIAFDLDGTLTQHKSQLDDVNRAVLERLAEKYHLLMLGAGSCERIYRQMGEFPIEIIGNYGMQHSVVRDGKFEIVESKSCAVDREWVDAAVTQLRREFGYEKFDNDRLLKEEMDSHGELVKKYARYQKMKDSPYFAAITFRYEGEEEEETYYIGI